MTTSTQGQARQKVELLEQHTQLYNVGLMVLDSLVEIRDRDTTRKIRYIRASSESQTSFEAEQTTTKTDTASSVSATVSTPIAVDEKKNGVAWLRPSLETVLIIIFLIFFVVLWLYVKKYLFLWRK